MKKTLKILSFILVSVMLMSAVTAVCFADGKLSEIVIEQTDIRVPEVKAYVYPVDDKGEIFTSMSGADTKIDAFLDDEPLTVRSFTSANDEGCCFIVVINTSAQETGYDNLRDFKNDIINYLDKLDKNDRLVLITCAATCETVLDGSESKETAKRIIDSISATSGISDMSKALDEAVRVSNLEKNSVPARHVLALYDKGAFLMDDDFMLEKAIKTLVENSLPLYFVCTSNTDEVQNGAYDFSRATGGMSFKLNGSTHSSATERMAAWVKSCFVLNAESQSNSPVPDNRTLKIVFTGSTGDVSVEKQVIITDNIPDTDSPVLLSAECEDDSHIKVSFSEAVLNADKPENYTVKADSDDHKIKVKEALYDDSDFTVKLTLDEELENGDYTLSISNVTDTSYEANELSIPGDEFSFTCDVGKDSSIDMKYVYIGGGVLLAVIVIIVALRSRKRKLEEERLRKEEEKYVPTGNFRMDQQTLSFEEPANTGNGLPVNLKIIMPNGMSKTIQIAVKDRFILGRSSKSDLRIDDDTVSALHAVLSNVGGKLVVSDHNSTNGTYINGMRVDRPRTVSSGDKLHIGNTDIIINC